MSSPLFEAIKQTRREYQEPTEYLNERHFIRPDILAQAQGFDFDTHLKSLKGPAIEVGGPSGKYHVLLGDKLPEDILVTNVSTYSNRADGRRVDMLADASRLPFKDEAVGSLFSSYLPKTGRGKNGETFDLRLSFFHEAMRTLEPNGLLVLQGMDEAELGYASSLGFTPVRIMETEGSLPVTGEYAQWDAVLMKADGAPGFNYSAEAINMPTAELAPAVGATVMGASGISAPGE